MEKLAAYGGEPYKKKPFPNWPVYDENEIQLVTEVIKSQNWWRVTGSKVTIFEEKFAKFQGCTHCLGVTNGTSAIQLALDVLEIGAGDEVIVPAMTFISTGLAVINCNATPIMVDIDPDTLCMIPEKFEEAITEKTKAVIPVHMAGNACNMREICRIAQKYNLRIIEDAAHSHGGEYDQKRLGSFGDISIFSFQNGKLMTCGEGGAMLTNHRDLYEKAYVIQDVGRPHGDKIYEHVVRGENFRMNEFQAALLLAQMDRVNEQNTLREKNALILDQILSQIEGIKVQTRAENTNIFTHYMYMFYYKKEYFNNLSREKFVDYLIAEGIPANVCFPIMANVKFIKENNYSGRIVDTNRVASWDVSNASSAADDVIWLHHRVLEGDELDLADIVGAIKKIQQNI